MITLGTYLKMLRTQFGLSQEYIARKLKVHSSTISRWEADQTYPDREQFSRILELFPSYGMKLSFLYSGYADFEVNSQMMYSVTRQKLLDLAEEKFNKSSCDMTVKNSLAKERLSEERSYDNLSINAFIAGFVSLLRNVAENEHTIITVGGKFNSLITSYLLAATKVRPAEWDGTCPDCGSKKCIHHKTDDMNGVGKCMVCGSSYVSQYCEYPYEPREVLYGFCPRPRVVSIDVSESFIDQAWDIAVAYFPHCSVSKDNYCIKMVQNIMLLFFVVKKIRRWNIVYLKMCQLYLTSKLNRNIYDATHR